MSGFLLGRKERDFTGKQWCKRWERRIFKDRNCAQLDLKMGGKRKKFQQTGCRASGHGAVHRRRTYGQRLLGKYERGNYGSWLVRGVHG